MIILNEREYVENILQEETIDPAKAYLILSTYARYLYHEKNLKKPQIICELNSFMAAKYPRYNPVDWSALIEKYACGAGKYPLCECTGVWLTETELNTIGKLQDKVLERLAFTLLCLAKFRNFRNPENNGWINYSNGEIYTMACINTTAFEKDRRLNQLMELGLIRFAKRVDSLSIQVLFTDDSGENRLFVSDFRKLGYEWKVYNGEKYIRCAGCGILTRRQNNHQKYCAHCSELMRNRRQKNIMRKRRKIC